MQCDISEMEIKTSELVERTREKKGEKYKGIFVKKNNKGVIKRERIELCD